MKLHRFFRSVTSHRPRIALSLRGPACAQVAVDLRPEQHLGAADKALHPQGLARWPLIAAVDAACGRPGAFPRAAPAVQPDAA